jgi:hypothetical protein
MEKKRPERGAPAFLCFFVMSWVGRLWGRLALDVELLGVEGGVAFDQDVFAGQLFEIGEPG